jgi:hypothetical protein
MAFAIIALDRQGRPFGSIVVVAASPLLAVRIGCFWYLQYLRWTNQERIDLLPLLVLISPKAFFLKKKLVWTTQTALVFSLALAIGTLLWVALATIVITRIRRYFKDS